ncbi:MAG: OmpA family protein, partial [Myxococcales bacterium]|nr:OmpA family protein [Myxococcales bacterium]
MRKKKTFPRAKALATSFVMALPDESERASSRSYNASFIAFGGKDRLELPLQPFDRHKLLAAAESAALLGSPLGTGGMSPLHRVLAEIGQQVDVESRDTAVMLFTDGLPDQPEKALAVARELTHDRKICFNGIQVGSAAAGAEFLRKLAAISPCGSSRNAASLGSAQDVQRYAKSVMVGTAPLPAVAAAPPASCAATIRLRGIQFGFDKAVVDDAGAAVLDAAVEVISGCPGARLQVDGYTDSTGSDPYNQGLSQRRAAAVRDYFVSKGMAADRIAAQGYGKDNPVAGNETPDGRARNRRVE